MPRFAARKDTVHNPIVAGLEKYGIVVLDTSRLGDGFPDVLCYHPQLQEWQPMEFKSGTVTRKYGAKKQAGYKLTELEAKQRKLVQRAPIPVVHNLTEGLKLFGINPGMD